MTTNARLADAGLDAYTQGPWYVTGADIHSGAPGTDRWVATVSAGPGDVPRAVDYANASLIAAAPELLAALRDFVSYGQCRMSNQEDRNSSARKFAALAEQHRALLERLGVSPAQMSKLAFDEMNGAAIAKAEGQARP